MPVDGANGDDAGGPVRREIRPDPDEAEYALLELIADLEDCDVTDLPPMYDRIDDLVSELFEDPPSKAAEARLEFAYLDYRITLDQTGDVTLRPLDAVTDGQPAEDGGGNG